MKMSVIAICFAIMPHAPSRVRLCCCCVAMMAYHAQAASLETLDGLEVSIPGVNDENVDGVHWFGLHVKQGGKTWTVMHRYNDFYALQGKLGPAAASLPDAPFPGKSWWRSSQSTLKERRKGLEKWSQQVLLHQKSEESWKHPLQEFFHPAHSPSLETLDGLEVSMPGHKDREAHGVHLFGLYVKQGGRKWTVMHRYKDFQTLKGKLGPKADSLPDAPFPGRFGWWPSQSMLEERRRGLEKWSQQVLLHQKSEDSWKQPLKEFFHPEAVIKGIYREDDLSFAIGTQAASLETLDGLEVSIPGHKDREDDGVHLFGVKVKQEGESWTVMHRYTDFHTLKGKLGPEAGSLPDAPFPGKSWWSSQSTLEERRKGLEKWLQQVLLHFWHADLWNHPLQEFLHPDAQREIRWGIDKLRRFGKTVTSLRKLCTEIRHFNASLDKLDGLEVSMPRELNQTDGAVHFFGVNVKQGGKEWNVTHRYNAFYILKEKLGAGADALPDAPFPRTLRSPFPSESTLEERRKGLEKWSQKVLLRSNSMDSWKEPLKEFFDEKPLRVRCTKDRLLRFAKTSVDKIGEWYAEGKRHCQEDGRCTAAEARYEKMKLEINERMQRLENSIDELKALAENGDLVIKTEDKKTMHEIFDALENSAEDAGRLDEAAKTPMHSRLGEL
jgi:hypothetical protein